ncbi:hypothetical protein GOBAR_DD30758 [Gossypium barbadense]|nr:hypothetical protein GOBAR_DD30758 [Gossypium barbadense]
MGSLGKFKPYFAAIFLQVGLAGMDILSKAALNQGMSNYVLVVYRHAIATLVMAPFAVILEKKVRPKMTISIFIKIMVLSLLEPVIDQNLYYVGMKYTTATFAAAMYNILPAITFLMAWILRLEKVNFRSIRSHAKVFGTLATVAGAMVMTLMKGPVLELFWTTGRINNHEAAAKNRTDFHDTIKGGLLISVGCFSYACFVILQAVTLKTYPAELSLTVWICLMGTLEATVAALVMETGKASIWAIKWDTKLLTAAYSGIVCSGLAYYIQGVIMKDRGPVFVTAFSPLCMVIVAIMASFILAEQMFLGRVIGAIIIIVGLYLVLWGKSKEYKSQQPLMEQQIEAAKLDIGTNNENGSFDHQAIIIDEKSQERRDSIVPKSAAPPHPLPPNINSSFLRTKSPPSQIAYHITGNKIRKSSVFSRGKLPGPLRQLQMDLRKLMLPYTALKLKEKKRNNLKDFLNVAGPIGVTHSSFYLKSKLRLSLGLQRPLKALLSIAPSLPAGSFQESSFDRSFGEAGTSALLDDSWFSSDSFLHCFCKDFFSLVQDASVVDGDLLSWTRKLKELLENSLGWEFQQKSAVDGIYFEENDEYAPVVEMLDEPSGSEPTS